MKITREINTAILMLLLKIIATDADCYYNPSDGCAMQCATVNTTITNRQIEEQYNKDGKEVCRENGISLRIMSIPYPNNTIQSNWFTAAVKVNQLEVSLNYVVGVSADAFNSNAFRTVKRLVFPNYQLELIRSGTFNGLIELEELIIQGAEGVIDIEKGILDPLTSLKEFSFEQVVKNNPAISINGFTGSEPLSKLEYVKIRYKLTTSIKRTTFTSLTNVKHLDLSSCQIESIAEYSFDPIANSIEELDLSGNKLTTVPSELFSTIGPNIKMIHIHENNWECDCKLLPLRMIIEQYPNNFTVANCISPPGCRTILGSDCFDDCDLSPTSSFTYPTTTPIPTSTPTTTTTSSTITTDLPNENHTIQCYKPNRLESSDTVSIKRPIGYMTMKENDRGEVNLNIEYEEVATTSVIIWFSNNRNSGNVVDEDINCISDNELDSIPITNLMDNVIYSFCLMDKDSTNVSPLDCISYMKRVDESESVSVWLLESSKTLTVILIVLSLVMNIVFGIAFGFWMFDYNPFSKRKSLTPKFSIQTMDSVLHKHETKDRLSHMTSYTTDTMLTASYQYNSSVCPPLPERPPHMKYLEEPVYASVEEVYKK